MKTLKFILILFGMLLVNIVLGSVLTQGAPPYVTNLVIASLMVVSLAGSVYAYRNKHKSGILAMALNITSIYAGEVLDQLLTRASTGNELVAGGHIRIVPNVTKKFTIPMLRAGSMLQKRKANPTAADSKGDFGITEKYLEPQDVMAYTRFNPRALESIWRPFQPTGNLVFSQLPPAVQNAFLAELAKVVDFELGDEYVNGVKGNNEGQYFDGILTRIVSSNLVGKQANTAAIDESNILTVFKGIRASLPKNIRKNPNLKFFVSIDDGDIYDNVITNQPNKGKDWSETNVERFKGIQIIPLTSWPKDVVVAAVASMDMDSYWWAGVSLVDDAEAILIDKVANDSEEYFFKMLMKADTNITFDEDIVLYDGRAAAVAAGSTDLANLVLGAGSIVPDFDAETKTYTLAVATGVSSTTVTATHGQAGQVLKVGSTTLTSGTASAARNLAVGENIINVTVTSADGNATATYQVLVTRAAS